VHRRLADPTALGRTTATRLHDVLIASLPALSSPRVLDAGCGLGGTLLDLATRVKGDYVGVTLSGAQAATALRAVRARGLADTIRILVQSYDHPPPGPFDLVLAIEALAHSSDPATSLGALAAVLAPGGLLVVVDDMPLPTAQACPDLATFKTGWRCPVLWDRDSYLNAFNAIGLDFVLDRDLTDDCRPRSFGRIAALQRLNRFVRRAVPSAALRELMDSHHAGLALERLTRLGVVRYRVLLARRGARAPQASDSTRET
jgi:SAM-dependent methyltransferase